MYLSMSTISMYILMDHLADNMDHQSDDARNLGKHLRNKLNFKNTINVIVIEHSRIIMTYIVECVS